MTVPAQVPVATHIEVYISLGYKPRRGCSGLSFSHLIDDIKLFLKRHYQYYQFIFTPAVYEGSC